MKKIILSAAFLLLLPGFSFAQWVQYSFLNTDPVQCVAAKGGLIVAGTVHGTFISIDGGGTWTNSSAGLTDSNITALMISGPNIISGSANGKIAYKTLLGTTWTQVNADSDPVSSFFKNGTTEIWAKHCCGICKTFQSSDNGASWTEKLTSGGGCFKNYTWSNNYFYHGDWTGPVSSPDGNTWTTAHSGYSETSDFNLMGADETGHIVLSRGYWGDASMSTLYYATATSSPTWQPTNSFYPGHTAAVRAFVGFSNFIFTGINDTATGTSHADNGIHSSTDGGINWYKDGGVTSGVNCLTMDSVYLYAGTEDGKVWKKTLMTVNTIGAIKTSSSANIFPNPSTGKFQVSFDNADPGESEVKIYNVTGETVYQCKSASSTIDLDLLDKSKGFYFIRIDNGTTIRYGRVVLQ